jgi:hypothetical protein
MAELTGSEILAKSLKNEGTDVLFFLMGGPMLLAESSCIKEGIRPLDVRHEQSAAFMGQAYSRLLQKPSVCMAASGPGVINLKRVDRLLPGRSGWRLKPDWPERPSGFSGDRSARNYETLYQMGRSSL